MSMKLIAYKNTKTSTIAATTAVEKNSSSCFQLLSQLFKTTITTKST